MPTTGIPTVRGGRTGGLSFTGSTTRSLATSTLSARLNFTTTLTLPVPPPGSTTVISLTTLSPTSITTTTTAATSLNFISTTTATTLSVTALPNPAATAAVAAESSLLNQNANLTRTNTTITLVLGSVAVALLIALLILLCLYLRRQKTSSRDSESPPFTSLAPRPAPHFGPCRPPQIPIPEQMHETFLSMGPRRGTADSYFGAMTQAQAQSSSSRVGTGQQPFPYPSTVAGQTSQLKALASNPVSPPTRNRPIRSTLAPTSAPEPAPSIPAFELGLGGQVQQISLFPATPAAGFQDSVNINRPGTSQSSQTGGGGGVGTSSSTFGAPLRRQRSVPMYHRALREQVEAERELEAGTEAQRLGVPVIGRDRSREGHGQRGSFSSGISSEMSFGSEDVDVEQGEEKELDANGEGSGMRESSGGNGGGDGGEGGNGGNSGQGTDQRGRVLHSTRASSGIFPEGQEGEEEGVEEKDVYS